MAFTINLTLAHPLSAKQAQSLGAEDVKDYGPGDPITLPRQQAANLINAGYAAGVNPQDTQAVAAALSPDNPSNATTSSNGGSGSGTAGTGNGGTAGSSGSGETGGSNTSAASSSSSGTTSTTK